MYTFTLAHPYPKPPLVASRLVSTEDELVVVIPAAFFFRHPGFDVSAGVVGTRATRADHLEPGIQQRVERLFEVGVFEEESGRVSAAIASVDVATFVQRIAKHFAAE